jgi:hypothetical protein
MSVGRERSDVATPATPRFTEESTRELSVAGTSDHCVNCGAALASDQRYCVNCGERRGKPRFTLAGPPEQPVQETTTRAVKPPRRPRTSSTFNLIAGVATLLLAMGVGVLIGHSNSNGNAKTAAGPTITVNGAGASTGAASAAGLATTGSGAGSNSGSGVRASHSARAKHNATVKAAKAPPKVVVQKAAAAASKVTGGSAKVANPTVTQGGSCQDGSAGCQNGHFTGNNFFGQ